MGPMAETPQLGNFSMFCRIVKRKMLKALSLRASCVSETRRVCITPASGHACALRQT